MKKFRMIAPVIAFVFAFATAFAFTPPMTGFYRDANNVCQSGEITTPSDGQCPGGNKVCQVGTHPAFSDCTVSAQLRYPN